MNKLTNFDHFYANDLKLNDLSDSERFEDTSHSIFKRNVIYFDDFIQKNRVNLSDIPNLRNENDVQIGEKLASTSADSLKYYQKHKNRQKNQSESSVCVVL
jgi:hypothetical protein